MTWENLQQLLLSRRQCRPRIWLMPCIGDLLTPSGSFTCVQLHHSPELQFYQVLLSQGDQQQCLPLIIHNSLGGEERRKPQMGLHCAFILLPQPVFVKVLQPKIIFLHPIQSVALIQYSRTAGRSRDCLPLGKRWCFYWRPRSCCGFCGKPSARPWPSTEDTIYCGTIWTWMVVRVVSGHKRVSKFADVVYK